MEIAGNDLCTRQGALKGYSSSGQGDVSYPLKIEQVLLKGLPGLCLLTLVYNIRILFVPTAFVVLAAVSLPISQTHPAEVMLAFGTLHVIAASVLFNTDITLGTLRKQTQLLDPTLAAF